jgi:glycosyltransferase involved in cell wall biosynthesis
MVPTYRPRTDYLEEALRSILQQDPGPELMQIEVVDDCSPDGAPIESVRRIAGQRIAVHCEQKNNGLSGIWNRCIERARGEWVHILHQDDLVLPGFYKSLHHGTSENPAVGMACCRFALTDSHGHWRELGPLEQSAPGILKSWLEKVTTGYHLECPAVVVRRGTYEQLGGFTPELTYALDLEMWVRIAARFPVYYEPKILACHRLHDANESSLRERTGENMMDLAKAFLLWKAYLPKDLSETLHAEGSRFWAGVALMLAQKFYSQNNLAACRAQLRAAEQLWNRGSLRRRRIKLGAKVTLQRAVGARAIQALRRLRVRAREI